MRRASRLPRTPGLANLRALALALVALGACPPVGLADEPTSREIYIPFDELPNLLAAPGQRVLLKREAYDALVKLARPTSTEPAPCNVVLLSASYDLTIVDAQARIRGELSFETLADGAHAVPLELEDVGLLAARLDGNDAAIGRAAHGTYTLFITGRGHYRLVLEMSAELRSASAQQQLTFRLPQAPAQRLRATVPGNVEVKQGAEVVARRVDEQAGVTRFELLPPVGKTTLTMSLNNRQQRGQRTVIARSVLIDEITTAFERLHATVSLSILHQPVERFRFRLPAGFDVVEVQSPALERWSVREEGQQRELDVLLRRPTTEQVVLRIAATRSRAVLDDWSFPRLEPLDVASQVAVLGVLLDAGLKPESLAPTGLIPLDVAALDAALPRAASAADEPAGRSVAAYYAPAAGYELRGRFSQPPPRLHVTSNLLFTVSETDLQLRAGLALLPEAERLFEFDVEMPSLWRVHKVTDDAQQSLAFDARPAADGKSRIRIRLATAIAPGTTHNVYVEAQQTPTDWLGTWTRREVAFPALSVVDAVKEVGVIAASARDDLNLRPETLRDLAPLDEAEKQELGLVGLASQYAFRYESPAYAASFVVQRNVPRATARTFSFFRIEPGVVSARYEVDFDIQRAKAHRLSLLLPATTPDTVSLVGLDGLRVKEYTSATVEGKNLRCWTALLAAGQQGRARLAIELQFPLPAADVKDYALPIVSADDVAYQSGIVAIEASGELDVQFVRHPLKVDVGQLAEADYEVGRRLLGVFGFVETNPQVTINVSRRPTYALPPALVQHAQYVTLLGNDGLSQTAAKLQLRSKLPYIEVDLPPGSTLWSADFDGQPALPQRHGKRLLIGFPADEGESLRTLQVVYETPVRQVSVAGRIKLPALSLLATGAGGDGRDDVPVADVQWEVYLPAGYRLLRSQGTLSLVANEIGRTDLAAWQLADWTGRQLARAPLGIIGTSFLLESGHERRGAHSAAISEQGPYWQTDDVGYQPPSGLAQSPGMSAQFQNRTLHGETSPVSAAPAAAPSAGMGGGMALDETAKQAPPLSAPAPVAAASTPATASERQAHANQGRADAAAAEVKDGQNQVGQGAGENQAGKQPARKQTSLDMLSGLRSLPIDLQPSGDRVVWQSFGVGPELDIFLVDARRVRLLAWLLALVTLVAGIAITSRPWRSKARFVISVGLLATLVPLVSGWFELAQVLNGSFYASCVLVPYYLVAGWCKSRFGRRVSSSVAAGFVAVAMFGGLVETQLVAAEPPIVVQVVPPSPPLKVPGNATVLLYDKPNGLARPKASRVLVPYERYAELWNLAHPDKKLTELHPPTDVAMAGATFSATLVGDEFLVVEGVIEFEVFVAGPVELPLAILGGVVSSAKIDGRPASLELVEPVVQAPQPPAKPLVALRAQGKGRRRLELTLRFKLGRNGGWRTVDGQLPAAVASTLNLLVPEARTELRLSDVPDRRTIETKAAGEKITAALPVNGRLRFEWRPRVDAGQADAALQTESDALVDVQEDGLRLAWQIKLDVGRTPREKIVLHVPADYLVERISGDNVRGWSAIDAQQPGRLEVQFLRPTIAAETILVQLSDRGRFGEQARSIAVPQVSVEGAALQTGQLTIRRSTVLDVETVAVQGALRVDLANVSPPLAARVAESNPLGMAAYEQYQFAAVPFAVELKVQPRASRAIADVQTVWKVGQRQRTLETRILWTIEGGRRLQLRAVIPQDLEIDQVVAPGAYEWAVTPRGQDRVLTIYLSAGQSGTVAVVVRGPLGPPGSVPSLKLPKIEALDVDRQQGEIVVQADPALNIETAELANCEVVLLQPTSGWLSGPQQRLARLALAYRNPNYQGTLRLSLRQPRVQGTTLTNVRLSDRSIEETILIDLTIREAGVREVVFLLPAALAEAKISAPLLRQKTIEPVAGQAGKEQVRVRIELQDAVMNDFRVLVEHDSLYTRETHEAPIPVLETGRTLDRYVALETSARDEVVVEAATGLEPVVRGQQRSAALAQLMTSSATQAFRVRSGAAEPRLVYRPRDRALVETVAARIGLAETELVCDSQGAYRGLQTYHVYNSTEAYLEVELPAGARIWTAMVAGEPVKPIQAGSNSDGRRVKIPLIKTAAGDLDYALTLTYGGKLPRFGLLSRVEFPLPRTVNIGVELSQVRLYLPSDERWLGFGGTMRAVAEEADLEAGSLSYLTKMTRRLTDSLRSDDRFAQTRAQANLGRLGMDVSVYEGGVSENEQLKSAYVTNTEALREAQQQAAALQPPGATQQTGNRQQLNTFYFQQDNDAALNIVARTGVNFVDDVPELYGRGALQAAPAGQFDARWFDQNGLSDQEQPADAISKRFRASRDKESKEEDRKTLASNKAIANQAAQPHAPHVQEQPLLPAQQVTAGMAGAGGAPGASSATAVPEKDVVQRYADSLKRKNETEPAALLQANVGQTLRGEAQGGQAVAANGLPAAGEQGGRAAGAKQAEGRGLASLAVEIPRRGTVYRFTTLRGDVEITSRVIPTALVESLSRLAIVVGVVLVAGWLFGLIARRQRRARAAITGS